MSERSSPVQTPPVEAVRGAILIKDTQNRTTKTTSNVAETRYVRASYKQPALAPVTPIVQSPEPRTVGGYVAKRTDRMVAALPPPSKRKFNARGNGKDEDDRGSQREPGKDRDEGGGERRNDGDGDGNSGPILQNVEREESDDEFEDAMEEPWPEDIWNSETEARIQAEARMAIEKQNSARQLALAIEAARDNNTRRSKLLDGPGWKQDRFSGWYELLADGKTVWSVRATGSLRVPVRGSVQRQNLSDLEEGGWIWDEMSCTWTIFEVGDFSKGRVMGRLPEIFRWPGHVRSAFLDQTSWFYVDSEGKRVQLRLRCPEDDALFSIPPFTQHYTST